MSKARTGRGKSLRTLEPGRRSGVAYRVGTPANGQPPAGETESEGKAKSGDTPVPFPSALDFLDYQRDVIERTIVFVDVLRRRANAMLEHEQAGLPPLLAFKHELILDARTFERPVNYALMRITDVGDQCWEDCVDPEKPAVIVLDPRAGHGPGIGGFKRDSEVGIALHTGHPVYFVVFYPEPCPGQTLTDALAALKRFVAAVAARHAGRAPILYGNCQAGWAATLVAAHCDGLTGPVVLNGSPLSYWAGEAGVNPMRIAAGFVGGAWLTHFLSDLNQDRFDGAWLVQSFENLKPGNAIWDKYANLFTRVDTEQGRFLDFERWWSGFYRLSGEEMVAIVENLFVGNRLEQGKLRVDEHCVADLRKIRNPLVIFASYGDNITPPHQALGWLPAVYSSTEELKTAGQRVVYLTNPHVGHLGIFVSASVARFEHRAILESLDDIASLTPGLYEMKIDNPTGDPDCRRHQYAVRFEPRRIEDIKFAYTAGPFELIRDMSEANEKFYSAFVSPWVRAVANPWMSDALKWLHPMRVSRYVFSERVTPWMSAFAELADAVSKSRHPLPDDHPLLAQERRLIEGGSAFWEAMRRVRDATLERSFAVTYGV